jgi:hypothetical protein
LHQDVGLHLWYSVELKSGRSRDSSEISLAAANNLRSNYFLASVLETVIIEDYVKVTDGPIEKRPSFIFAEPIEISNMPKESSLQALKLKDDFIVQVFTESDHDDKICSQQLFSSSLGHRKWSGRPTFDAVVERARSVWQ